VAATLAQSEFTYLSGTGTQLYRWTVVVPQTGNPGIRNIQGPFGLIIDSFTEVPESVVSDMTDSLAQVGNILASTTSINGTLVFAASTEQSVTFATPLSGTTYRVHVTTDSFVPLRITNKTMTGFTVQAGAEFTGAVGYDVFV
jgi:hypothetical protein